MTASPAAVEPLRAPFPWFGGKARIAAAVWERFGDTQNYVEPFFGSGAVLLNRPHTPNIETVNDMEGMVANFWRALATDPEAVARHADWPVSELDLHARHTWLVNAGRAQVERLRAEPDFFDPKIAGWWGWGLCQWIGSGWCAGPESKQLPHLGDAGRGLHRPSQQRSQLGSGNNNGMLTIPDTSELLTYFRALAHRLRRVRVCCGDWSRVCGPSPTFKQGMTTLFLDPPYDLAHRDPNLYSTDAPGGAAAVRKWCHANGHHPLLRIALCGYTGEGHESLEADGWAVLAWKAHGGYGNQSQATTANNAANNANPNAKRERVWFSPHCLKPKQPGLFDETED